MPITHLGVAGLGWLGESLIKDAIDLPEFRIVAVQDVVPEREREIAQLYGAAPCQGRFQDLLEAPNVEAVLLCTPNGLHAEQAELALEAGKDVLVQKPLALSFADASRAVETASRCDRILFVDYTYRFLDTMRVLQDAVREIRAVRAVFHNIYGPGAEKRWFFNPSQSGGGALTDLGVHLIDLGLWLVHPAGVAVESAELSSEEPVEYSANLSLRLDDVPFDVAVSWNAPLPMTEISFEITTAAGSRVRWENVNGSFFHFRTVHDDAVLSDHETTLREDTLRAFASALESRQAPLVDTRVYSVLDQAYGR